ncbi:MAG: hypothetical protein IKP77_04030 [Acholeplasmatales bacterium]|nr:hypothetical protein [Acholeplasmatales bacterium]
MKPYVFNGIEYNDLNSLALAYKEKFDLGIEDIYANSKKIVKFLKERTNNKDRVKNLVDILALSKFKNNALTFVIFDFLDIKEVVINGETITFEEMIDILKRNPNVENNIIFSFISDHGITRCYERMDPTNKKFRDMYFVERYYDHPFTYKYLTTLFDFEVKEAPDAKVKSIIIENDECFRRATKLISQESFQLWIAKKYGFKEAIKVANEKNPVFYALKLLKSEVDEDELRKILSDSFFWWLLDNFEKYDYAKKSILIKNKLMDIKRMYNGYLMRIDRKEINKISFDNYAEISRSLYLSYLDFVYYLKDGSITVNRKFDQKKYLLDKPYCYTYISEDYMKGKVIKLYKKEEDFDSSNGENNVVIDDKNINDEFSEKPLDISEGNDEEIFLRQKNYILSDSRFASFTTFMGFLAVALFSLGIALNNITFEEQYKDIQAAFSMFNIVFGIIGGVLALGFGIFISIYENKREEALADYRFYLDSNSKDYISLVQEERYYKVKNKLDSVKKLIINRKKLFTVILGGLLGFSIALISVLLVALALNFIKPGKFQEGYDKALVKLLIMTVPLLLGFLIGLLKKKNPFLIFIYVIAIIGFTFAMIYFL